MLQKHEADAFVYFLLERDGAFKEQPSALRQPPAINIQKCLLHIFATVYFVRSFFF